MNVHQNGDDPSTCHQDCGHQGLQGSRCLFRFRYSWSRRSRRINGLSTCPGSSTEARRESTEDPVPDLFQAAEKALGNNPHHQARSVHHSRHCHGQILLKGRIIHQLSSWLLVSELVIILVIFSFRWLLHWFWQFFSLWGLHRQSLLILRGLQGLFRLGRRIVGHLCLWLLLKFLPQRRGQVLHRSVSTGAQLGDAQLGLHLCPRWQRCNQPHRHWHPCPHSIYQITRTHHETQEGGHQSHHQSSGEAR
mmetsp:Transcript_72391/g.159913  ORF Transcript_72391/g.159913 Transcript_72391/m.159913 type:complete len:249 (-) Transcript_72391:483-1229(-)